MESLSPFLWRTYISYNMPVHPGALRVTRHPTGIADSTLPSLWSNADFRRANIDTLRRRLHNPLPRGGVAAEQVVSALAVDVIDGLHSTASGRFFAWVIGGAAGGARCGLADRCVGSECL